MTTRLSLFFISKNNIFLFSEHVLWHTHYFKRLALCVQFSADDILKYFSLKTGFDIFMQIIYMKCQHVFCKKIRKYLQSVICWIWPDKQRLWQNATLSRETIMSSVSAPFWKGFYSKRKEFTPLGRIYVSQIIHKAPSKFCSRWHSIFFFFFFFFFSENKPWHFMWLICQADVW